MPAQAKHASIVPAETSSRPAIHPQGLLGHGQARGAKPPR
jgi:hypothetical protein